MRLPFFARFDAERVGYRLARLLRDELTRLIRDYEARGDDRPAALTEDQLERAVAQAERGGDAGPAPDAPTPINAAQVKEHLDELLDLCARRELYGFAVFRAFADGSYDHYSLSLDGGALRPEDYALAGAAFSRLAVERAGWEE